MSRAVAMLAGVVLLGLTLQDAFEVMLLPRRVARRFRLVKIFYHFTWAAWSALARRLPSGARREQFISVYGALSMVLLFTVWASCLIVAFGLIQWALISDPAHASSVSEQIYMSGVAFFTLGYGDVVPHTTSGRLLAVIEAGTGFGFIAVVIGYLPVLYQLFSRREAHVIQLDGRAGSPPSAGTLLRRHAEGDGLDKLDLLLRDWEVWAAELLESHLSYPMLAYYRSQHENESWLAAVACIMDTCALVLVGVGDIRPLQARMTFTMARQVLVDMATSFGVTPSRYTGGDRLGEEGRTRLAETFARAKLRLDDAPETWETLAALRATYEPLLDGLACYLLLEIPRWVGTQDTADNWQRGHRGAIASRLIHELTAGPAEGTGPTRAPAGARPWRKLRARLRGERRPV